MDVTHDPRKLIKAREVAQYLEVPTASLGWRNRRGELAIPTVWIGPKSPRWRRGDIMLVTTGQRPAWKQKDEPKWDSPYAKTES